MGYVMDFEYECPWCGEEVLDLRDLGPSEVVQSASALALARAYDRALEGHVTECSVYQKEQGS